MGEGWGDVLKASLVNEEPFWRIENLKKLCFQAINVVEIIISYYKRWEERNTKSWEFHFSDQSYKQHSVLGLFLGYTLITYLILYSHISILSSSSALFYSFHLFFVCHPVEAMLLVWFAWSLLFVMQKWKGIWTADFLKSLSCPRKKKLSAYVLTRDKRQTDVCHIL